MKLTKHHALIPLGGILLGAVAWSYVYVGTPLEAEAPLPPQMRHRKAVRRQGQKVTRIAGYMHPDTAKPEFVATCAALIVRGTVAKREPARYVVDHPVWASNNFGGNYAWVDYRVEDVRVIGQYDDAPRPGKELWLRVYRAETPEVSFMVETEPESLTVGGDYILFLTDVDAFAFNEGPEHWRLVSGLAGVYRLSGDRAVRQASDEPAPVSMTIDALMDTIHKKHSDTEIRARHRKIREIMKYPKGVRTSE